MGKIKNTFHYYSLIGVLLLLIPSVHAQKSPKKYAETITEEELKEMLYEYASDDFQGRDTGSEGQKKAVAFLQNYYVNHNIKAAQSEGKYFQNVPLKILKPTTGTLSVNEVSFILQKDAYLMSSNKRNIHVKEIVYLGYGIDSTGVYSDYKNMNVSGKVVFIKQGELKDKKGNYRLSGSDEATGWSKSKEGLKKKIQVAQKHGALAVIAFSEDGISTAENYYEFLSKNNRMTLDSGDSTNIPILIVTKDLAEHLYPKLFKKHKSKTLKINFSTKYIHNTKNINSENVVAYIKGAKKPDEYVIISAHLDHIGVDDDGNVFNGADDDGSGTVALLEIAEAFKKAVEQGHRPKRSIVFLHVTGEEKGLFGSKYYTEHPIFPLENTVTNLNIDMIGRIDPNRQGKRNYVYLIGADKLSTELDELSKTVNQSCCGLELDYTYNDENDPNRFYYRSDHYNFAKHNIPIIFYFNGVHEDYHKITDTPDKINYDLLANRAKLVFYTAWEIANMNHKLVVDKEATE